MIDAVFHALAETRRRQLLWLIRDQERTAGEIADYFPEVTRPAISQHLHILDEAGLVVCRRAGTRRFYRLRPEGLSELRGYLAAFWEDRLSVLKTVVENEEGRSETK
jgi:DNA-binding transcriptional ArsR family regulator